MKYDYYDYEVVSLDQVTNLSYDQEFDIDNDIDEVAIEELEITVAVGELLEEIGYSLALSHTSP